MYLLKKILPFINLLVTAAALAQTTLPIPTNIQATYDKETRTTSGAPGRNYWQNHADYNLTINFSPRNRVLDGIDEI